jgi:hypothetical protein
MHFDLLIYVKGMGLFKTTPDRYFVFVFVVFCVVYVAQLVESYMPEGRDFDSRWYHWNFSLT